METIHVKKQCSLANYLAHEHPKFLVVIRSLCLGRILSSKRNEPGVTLLIPNEALMKKLYDDANGADPEGAVETVLSCSLSDLLTTPAQFEQRKADIPDKRRHKLGFDKLAGSKVLLKGGGVLVRDPKFSVMKRTDRRTDMAVWLLSGDFPSLKTERSTRTMVRKKPVKGGGDMTGACDALIRRVIVQYSSNTNTDACLELLVSVLDFAMVYDPPLYEELCTLLSYDTFATMLVIFAPYVNANSGLNYLSLEFLTKFGEKMSSDDQTLINTYAYVEDPVARYKFHMAHAVSHCDNQFSDLLQTLVGEIRTLQDRCAKPTVCVRLLSAVRGMAPCMTAAGLTRRAAVLANGERAIAEAELRVLSAMMHDNTTCARPNVGQLNRLAAQYKGTPYIVRENMIRSASPALYFSTALLIARSTALVSFPELGATMANLDAIAQMGTNIRIDARFVDCMNALSAKYRERSASEITRMRATLAIIDARA